MRAEAVRVLSESRRRVSWLMRVSRCGSIVRNRIHKADGGMNLVEKLVDLRFGLLLFFGWRRRDIADLRIL